MQFDTNALEISVVENNWMSERAREAAMVNRQLAVKYETTHAVATSARGVREHAYY
mgnify:CR=1 FL=1